LITISKKITENKHKPKITFDHLERGGFLFYFCKKKRGMTDKDFIKALESNDVDLMAKIPKSDLHNHSELGSRIDFLEQWCGKKIIRPPKKMQTFFDFEEYLDKTFDEFLKREGFFEHTKTATFQQAKDDGVKVLQISIDTRFYKVTDSDGRGITEIVKEVHRQVASEISFMPQLGLDRKHNLKQLLYEAELLLETGYFRSIDLYGDELFGDIENFIPLYRKAKNKGMVLTAHAGEYGCAESVRRAVELLELDQVQHGIAASDSEDVMKWLADNKIILNVCPTSNVMLCRVESIEKHPIRKLFDNGVKVTVNTDDLMVFNQSVSDEYFNLYHAGVLGAEALDEIRQNGLNAFNGL
jgi:adenosine deaminase